MNPEKTKNAIDTKQETADSNGFNWQQYKDDRRELHEKLTREQEKLAQPVAAAEQE